MLKKIDTKTVLIIILTILVIILMVAQSKNNIYYYKKEINELNKQNRELRFKYDSISDENHKIDSELKKIYGVINITEKLIAQYDNKIKDLKNDKNETSNRVNILNANGVAVEFTNYIKKRRNKNIR